MKQKSNRPLNKGKLFNIGYMLNKDKFDYFCFHDSDLIPISDECDYQYEEKPISLVGMRNKIIFGDQEKFKILMIILYLMMNILVEQLYFQRNIFKKLMDIQMNIGVLVMKIMIYC